MKTIRGKLFVSIGIILVVVAILSYAIPKFFVERDINHASSQLSDKFTESAKKIQLAFTTMIAGEFLEQLTQLEGFTKLLAGQHSLLDKTKPLVERTAQILEYSTNLSYIQASEAGETSVIAPEEGRLYTPSWAKIDDELSIKLSDGRVFTAKPNKGSYLLYPSNEIAKEYTPFDQTAVTLSAKNTPTELYNYMQWEENKQIEKVEMIQILAKNPKAAGVLNVDPAFKKGQALLSSEVFLSKPAVEQIPLTEFPFIALHESGGTFYLDFLLSTTISDLKIVLGYSLSNAAFEVATIMQRPLLLSEGSSRSLLYFPDGSQAILPKASGTTLNYEGIEYVLEPHQIGKLTISLLTPSNEATSIIKLMSQLKGELVKKISINLLLVTFAVFLIALLMLARISKYFTRPITQLAHASEEIGIGHLTNLELPKVANRKDEIAVLTHSFEGMVIALQDREKIRGALNKVVSKEVATQILKSKIELGGEERVTTLLFSDIRNFTPLSNKFTPKELIQMLNQYMTHMCHIIDLNHGVVDKFVGDEIMALYGAPLEMEDQADRALLTAKKMIHDLKKWNAAHEKPLEIGIGIHTGAVCAGNMGAENRLNYTVIGANVNLASRMCAAAKPMQILVTKDTIEALTEPQQFTFKEIPPMRLKGFDEPITLYELIT